MNCGLWLANCCPSERCDCDRCTERVGAAGASEWRALVRCGREGESSITGRRPWGGVSEWERGAAWVGVGELPPGTLRLLLPELPWVCANTDVSKAMRSACTAAEIESPLPSAS